MGFQLIGGDTSNTSAIVNQVNQNIAQLKVQDVTNIFKDDTGTRRVLLGKGKDGFYGMKVSQAGTDVYDGTNDDMVFNSDNNLFKIVQTGTVTVTKAVNDAAESATATHDLGYVPLVIAFSLTAGDATLQPVPTTYAQPTGASSGLILYNTQMAVSDTNITFSVVAPDWGSYYSSEMVVSFKYYILQETAN